ncbi:hypothetical protein [Rickettsiella endosymbiont of Rhagonycha lignosa]|uniref:hypothetical protein n=1 Tax=Rickettsiella endosymbiont of Rhagonycha lignosa TaxID=3077937 RepID=UPI00313E2EAB
MSKPYLKIIESTNSFFQNVILSAIFVFKSNIYQIGSYFEKYLAPILFPLVVIPDAVASLFALYQFARAKNKNLGKIFDLIHAPIKAALVFTAVFAGLSLIFVQGLFLTAVGSSVVYHLGLSIFHVYHWLKSEKNSPARALHKNHTLNNLIATMLGGIVIAGIILTMVVAPYLATTVLAVAGITTASLLMLATICAIYRNFKNPSLSPTINLLNEGTSEINQPSSFDHSASSTFSHSSEIIPTPKNKNSNYYYREFRSAKLTGNQEQDKNLLIEEYDSKKLSLQRQIENSKNSFFGRVWSEESKRQIKISTLTLLETAINSNDKSLLLLIPNQAYQSLGKETGDMQDIIEATESYFRPR